jgi:hypothetical protein
LPATMVPSPRRLPHTISPQEEAVRSELVSSLLAGKIQGNSSILASVIGIPYQKYYYNQRLTIKFPTQRNRELIVPEQGIKSAHQGCFPADQGIPGRATSSVGELNGST